MLSHVFGDVEIVVITLMKNIKKVLLNIKVSPTTITEEEILEVTKTFKIKLQRDQVMVNLDSSKEH